MKPLSHKTGFVVVALTAVVLAANLLYFGWLRNEVHGVYEGRQNWFSGLVNALYPQFQVEKQRLSLHFFLNKADQVVLRANLLLAFCIVATLVYPNGWARFIQYLSEAHTTMWQVRVLRILYFTCLLGFVKDWPVYLQDYQAFRSFYDPLPILGFVALPYPSSGVIMGMGMLLFQGGIFAAMGIWPIWHAVQTYLLCVVFNAYLQGFGKIDHAWVVFGYAGIFIPFLLWAYREAKKKNISKVKAWPLCWIQLCVALGYLMSGLEKVTSGAWAWFSGEQLTYYIYLLNQNTLEFLPERALSVAASLLAIAFQLTFWVMLWKKHWKPFFLASGIIFHFSTVWFLGVGAVASPWIAVYIFFLDWDKMIFGSNFTNRKEFSIIRR